uniref:Exportin-T n=1 Tax=Ornithodoros turicata TaxID=34597 RepID=A0A2R5L8T3_9ACAR
MDVEAIQGFLSHGDQGAHRRALQYFEQLKESSNGWQLSVQTLLDPSVQDDSVKFFCISILEHYVKTGYSTADERVQQAMRNFISQWLQMKVYHDGLEPVFVRNKMAQLVCRVFLCDYPARWPEFFTHLLSSLSLGAPAVDSYLRTLLAINGDVADKDIPHTPKEMERNTMLKDTIRERHVVDLVNSWYTILTSSYQGANEELTCLCLDVIGAYVAWIDIGLIANDRFVSILVQFLSMPSLREASCECIYEIVGKGMDPLSKVKLIQSLSEVLQSAGILGLSEVDDVDFSIKLAKLVNRMGIQLITCLEKLPKKGVESDHLLARKELEGKVPLMLHFLGNEDDDVSQAVAEFAREYVQLLKQEPLMYSNQGKASVQALLYIIINKYKYDESYLFDRQGEDEALFLEYRKTLKVLFDNVAQLDKEVTLSCMRSMICTALQNWRSLPFQDVEVALSFLYMLAEAIPGFHCSQMNASGDNVPPMFEMLRLFMISGVSMYGHIAVTLQYFETMVRYEKFFNQETQYIPEALVAFMDERGLRNPSPKVRSRVSYLFSRFIKSLRAHLLSFTEHILSRLEDLLALCPTENGLVHSSALLSPDDQLYLFEATAVLIISDQFPAEKKQLLMKGLLIPVMSKFESLAQQLPVERDEQKRSSIVECMSHAMAVTSRTSKAFSNHQTMKSCNCVAVYLEALQVFLQALDLPCEQGALQSGVRQFLHRLVVCLEEEVLPHVPTACDRLLQSPDVRSIQELIPLINQIVCKFKKEVVPFLQRIFLPLVKVIFGALATPIDPDDQQAQRDRQLLQRAYFLFVAAIVTNNVIEVIACQDAQSLEQVFNTIIQGAVDFPDPVAQRTCFTILKKMVELWGGPEAEPHFVDFLYSSIVPVCFHAPLKDSFDLTDAQTVLALSEVAACMQTIWKKRGEELITYLKVYLPSLRMSQQQVEAYVVRLRCEPKGFRDYIKVLFNELRSS